MKAGIRVALVELPQLIREILEHEFSQHADFDVVRYERPAIRRGVVVPAGPDAVIVAAEPDLAAEDASSLLDIWPNAAVLVVSRTGRISVLFDLRPHTVELGHLSASEIAQAIRSAVERRRQDATL